MPGPRPAPFPATHYSGNVSVQSFHPLTQFLYIAYWRGFFSRKHLGDRSPPHDPLLVTMATHSYDRSIRRIHILLA